MASRILLGHLVGEQDEMTREKWDREPHIYRCLANHERAIIAKGNAIEGIEAKE